MLSSLFLNPPIKAITRRVFFSFHFQRDIWRVNQVRRLWFRKGSGEEAGYWDASLWEQRKRSGADALKSLICDGLDRTSVTCVLAGTDTYLRRWVRYEIVRSFERGNGLLTVDIHNLRDNYGQTDFAGQDPFEYLGIFRDGNMAYFAERIGNEWVIYSDYTRGMLADGIPNLPYSNSIVMPLSQFSQRYDWVVNDGEYCFPQWISNAALVAGR